MEKYLEELLKKYKEENKCENEMPYFEPIYNDTENFWLLGLLTLMLLSDKPKEEPIINIYIGSDE